MVCEGNMILELLENKLEILPYAQPSDFTLKLYPLLSSRQIGLVSLPDEPG